ncbi:MAG: sulfatase-like hydrolase/transferase [Gammaproteobacteria bacterium]|nr:sulfatase-like hydrolase/transferase [Gammaproteobacteria bacterium]
MAVYAAMIDRMDQSVGRLVTVLKQRGLFEDTVIMFLSDNGGCAEFLHEDGWCQWYNHPTWDGRPMRVGNDREIQPGGDDTFMSYGLPWANASNTPFRLFKHFVHEGGISTPVILSGNQFTQPGKIIHTPCHVQDIMPTFLDLAGVACPGQRGETDVQSMEGESFVSLIHDKTGIHDEAGENSSWQRTKPICLEHEGNGAIRKGKWKAVRKYPNGWELYDMDADRTELNDLAGLYPGKLKSLIDEYKQWANRCGVGSWPPGDWPDWMNKDEFRGA